MTTAAPHPLDAPAATPVAGTPRVLFACGGTGGHVYPAIAIADAVRAQRPTAAIAFAGTRDRMEWEAVPKAGYPIHAITVSGFQRGLSASALKRNLSFPFKLMKGLAESWRLIGSFDPDVVVGTGGYASGPVGLAGSLRGRKLVVQEQNAIAGATNTMLARRADRVFVAFDAARDAFARETTVAGNPVRQDLLEADRAEALAHFGFPHEARVLLVFGGSLGAKSINDAVTENLDALLASPTVQIVWAAGKRYYDALAPRITHERVRLLPYLDRMDLAYAAADLAVCRSGAITCSELAVTGTPSVLVPSPNVTADHQTQNALALGDAAIVLPEAELATRFASVVPALLTNDAQLLDMQEVARAEARPDAARTIAEAVLALSTRPSA